MNSKFIFNLSLIRAFFVALIVALFVSACSTTETKESMSATSDGVSDVVKKSPSNKSDIDKDGVASKSSKPPVKAPGKAPPNATQMPADVTPEIQPAPVEKKTKPISQNKKESKKDDKAAALAKTKVKTKAKTAKTKKTPAKKIDPNYFILTVTEKNQSHPSFGKGHKLGFVLDDVQGKTIALRRGSRYEFDVRTNPLHDVYFSTSPEGWGGGAVINGVKGQFTYKGVITVKPNKNTPDVMYYMCRNHSTMGGKVFVVNKNTSKAKVKKLIASVKSAKPGAGQSVKKAPVSKAKVKQKMTFADMMFNSSGTKRVDASNNTKAKEMMNSARKKMDAARKQLSSGNNEKALTLADAALRLIGASATLVPSEEVLEERNTRYLDLLEAVENFAQAHKETYARTLKKRGKKAAVDYDKKEIASLLKEAKSFVAKRKYLKAIPLLEKSENIITSAINVMLDSQTIVYDLKFETAEDEYKYELKRFKGYEDLVPIAIARKRPAPGAVKLMDGFVEKGRSQRQDAIKKAKQGDFPTAIAMMLSATTQVRRALRIAGVSQ